MAKRKGGYRNNPYNAKAYKFTARRRAALKKAQAKSARERRIKVGIMAAGGVAAVGTALYLGRNTAVGKGVRRDVAKQVRRFSPQHIGRAQNLKRARAAVNPVNKEVMRMAGAISPADTPRAAGTPLHIGPHTPGDQITNPKPDQATFRRTDLGRQSDASVKAARDAIAAEEAWRKSDQGSLARFTDTSESSGPHELIEGQRQPVRRETANRAVAQHQNARLRSGAPAASQDERRDTVNQMIAGDISAVKAIRGIETPIRTNPRATGPTHISAASSQAEQDALWAEYDAQRGLSATRPGTVPHTTASASHTTSVPGVGTSHSAAVSGIGQIIPGWRKLSKEQKAAKRALASSAGLKIDGLGKISRPGAPKPQKPKPPANPSGKSVSEIHGDKILARAGYDPVSEGPGHRLAPGHGSKVGGWEHMDAQQKSIAQAYAYKFGMYVDARTGIYKTRKR
jgi:hypothetical protein